MFSGKFFKEKKNDEEMGKRASLALHSLIKLKTVETL